MAGGGARTDALTEETSEQCYRSNTRLSCRRVELSDFPSANTSTIKEGVYDARFRCDNMLASRPTRVPMCRLPWSSAKTGLKDRDAAVAKTPESRNRGTGLQAYRTT